MSMLKEILKNITDDLWIYLIIILIFLCLWYVREEIKNLLAKAFKVSLNTPGGGFSVESEKKEKTTEEIILESKEEQTDSMEEGKDLKEKRTPVTKKDWEFEMFFGFIEENNNKVEKAKDKLLELSESEEEKEKYLIMFWEQKLRFASDSSGLTELEKYFDSTKFSQKTIENAHVAMARIRSFLNEYKESIKLFEKALSISNDDKNSCIYICNIALNLYKNEEKKLAFDTLEKALVDYKEDELQVIIYSQIADLYEKDEEPELRAFAIEKQIELGDENKERYFDAGYSYSANNLEKLALLHYQKALKLGSGAGTLNNLGVQYEVLKMPIKSINKYNEASKKEETLSVANKAYRLIEVGFIDEAKSILKEAQQKENPHQNVSEALASISKSEENEGKIEENVIKEACTQRAFFQKYAKNYFTKSECNIKKTGYKIQGKYSLNISIENGKIIGMWEEPGYSKDIYYKHKFEGELHNNASKIKFFSEDIRWSILNKEIEFKEKTDGYLYIDINGSIGLLQRSEYNKQNLKIVAVNISIE